MLMSVLLTLTFTLLLNYLMIEWMEPEDKYVPGDCTKSVKEEVFPPSALLQTMIFDTDHIFTPSYIFPPLPADKNTQNHKMTMIRESPMG